MTPLHTIGTLFRELFALIPLPIVRGLFVLTFVLVLLWVLWLPRETARSGPTSGWSEDLRLWASLALLVQIVIYAVL